MRIRRATPADLPGIDLLLEQVREVHHRGRPDLFKASGRKYTDEQLLEIIADDTRPVFVAVADDAPQGQILGYAFCVHQQHPDDNVLTAIRTLYIDDLCVEEQARGMHVGSRLYDYVVDYARTSGCYNVTLNVWSCNPAAYGFYERMGLVPQKVGMERIL